jgi:hypothetical protein
LSDETNKWTQPTAPPPPLFTNKKEKDFVKQVNDELIERVIGQVIAYYPIDVDSTSFHPVYGEAINKTFLPPIRVHALVKWGGLETTSENYGLDKNASLEIYFHKKRLTDDQNLFAREGDFVLYGKHFYEIVGLTEPKELFGRAGENFEIVAKCIRAREGLFDGQ